MSLSEIECEIVYWFQLAEDNISSEISWKGYLIFGFYKKMGIFWPDNSLLIY